MRYFTESIALRGVVVLLVGRRTCDIGREFECCSAPLRSGLGQVTYTCVPQPSE